MTVNLATCSDRPLAGRPPGPGPRSCGTLMEPRAKPAPSLAMPRKSARAVAMMSTRESRSSIQSTGTSWMRSPARSARTSSSVSKNHPVSLVSGSSARA